MTLHQDPATHPKHALPATEERPNTQTVERMILENIKQGSISRDEALDALEAIERFRNESVEEIAVVGMSGTAAMSEDLDALWDNLINNRTCYVGKPAERLPSDRVWLNPYYAELFNRLPHEEKDEDLERFVGAYLPSTAGFDENYFGITSESADDMDPQHRVFMQQIARALEDAGYSPSAVRGSLTGVFAGRDGTNSNIYKRVVNTNEASSTWEGILASRLNYEYDLRGPALVVDTACSASLVALHLACNALRSGDCTMAIAGGIGLTAAGQDIDEIDYNDFLTRDPAPGGVNSHNFRVSTFDAKADGTVFGEGACAVVLKKLSDAERDGDHIYGVIASTAINSDGASNGLTSPNPRAQTDLFLHAWDRANVDPEKIEYIETHGTATTLGDPIEALGMSNAFRIHTDKRQFCGVGSLKTNLGHTVGAAGVLGVIKVLMSMQNEVIPASINFQEPNRQIDFVNSAIYVLDRNTPWPKREDNRFAGVSAFGFSGTNAHAIVRDYHAPERRIDETLPKQAHLFTVSAKTESAFNNYLNLYREYFAEATDVRFEDVCHTATTGRDHYQHRLVINANSMDDLCQKFEAFMNGGRVSDPSRGILVGSHRVVSRRHDDMQRGDIRAAEWYDLNAESAAISKQLAEGTGNRSALVAQLARLYVRGADTDFTPLLRGDEMRAKLPTYPFDDNFHWGEPRVSKIEPPVSDLSETPNVDGALVRHRIVETDDMAVYRVRLDHDLWVVTDHRILDRYFVAGTTLMELMSESVADFLGTQQLTIVESMFYSPIYAEEDAPVDVQIIVQKAGPKTASARIVSRLVGSEDGWTSNSSMTAEPLQEQAPKSEYRGDALANDPDLVEHDVPLVENFGPRWNNLSKLWQSQEDPHVAFGYAELPKEFRAADEADGYLMHPGLLDCTLSMVPYLTWLSPRVYLPMMYQGAKFYRPLPSSFYLRSERLPSSGEEVLSFRTTFFTEDGELIAKVDRYSMKRVVEIDDFVTGTMHSVIWEPHELEAWQVRSTEGDLLLVGPDSEPVRGIAEAAGDRRVLRLEYGDENREVASGHLMTTIDGPSIAEALTKLDIREVTEFVDASAFDPTRTEFSDSDLDVSLEREIPAHINLLKATFAQAKKSLDVFVLVDNISVVDGKEPFINAAQAAKASISKAVKHEVPNYTFTVIDAGSGTPLATVLDEMAKRVAQRNFVAFRDGQRYVPVMVETPSGTFELSPLEHRGSEDGFYLVTGGLGALGSAVAQSLSYHATSPSTYVLTSRRNPLPPREEWRATYEADPESRMGKLLESMLDFDERHQLVILEMDIANAEDVNTKLNSIRDQYGPMLGLIHAAGVAGDGYLFTKSADEFQSVMAPKARGLRNIHDWAMQNREPDFWMSFSSMTATIGGAGQSDYTAANTFLDAYTAELRRRGMRAQTINWPGWADRGMAYNAGLTDGNATFFHHLKTGAATTVFHDVMTRDMTTVIPGKVNLDMMAAVGEDYFPFDFSDALRRSLRRQADRNAPKDSAGDDAALAVRTRAELDLDSVMLLGKPMDQLTELEKVVAYTMATVLNLDEVDVFDSFTSMGGNSIASTELMRALNSQFGDVLNISDMFSHTTAVDLAGRIGELIDVEASESAHGEGATVKPAAEPAAPARSASDIFDDLINSLADESLDTSEIRGALDQRGEDA